MKLEICVDTIEAATIAAVAGVTRIELCSALSDGGLTPSYGVMKQAGKLPVSCHAMIRPRAQGFVYSATEPEAMHHDISAAKDAGMNGVVFGVLNEDSTLNLPALRSLIKAAQPLEVTLHRAIDMTPKPLVALEQAIKLGFQRILTSGQCETAFEGTETIYNMVSLISDSIAVFKHTGVEELAMELALSLSSGEAQYDLDSSWGLTPILQYENLGFTDPYFLNDDFWGIYTAGISTGGPEPMVTDVKAHQTVFVNMIQGIALEDDTVENLVTIAGEELAEIE